MGLLSKENAVAILAFAIAAKALVRSGVTDNERLDGPSFSRLTARGAKQDIRVARIFYLLTVVAAFVMFLLVAALHFGFWSDIYAMREYTMVERALTQLRALWWYLGQIVAPRLSTLGLYHDGWIISSGLFPPWTTVCAAVGWLTVACVAFWARGPLSAWLRWG